MKTTATWILGVLGWVLSYALFVKWLNANGWDFFGGWYEAFTASDFATGLLVDLVVTSTMLIAAAIWDRDRLGTKWTVAVLLSLCLSVSMALAIYLVGMWRSADAAPSATPALAGGSPAQ
jgi:hypothetical protein